MLTTKKMNELPHPNSWNIFLGNLLQLRNERIDFLIDQQKKLGDIYQIKIPTRKVIVVTNPEYIKHILVDNNKNYTKSFAYDSIKLFLGNGLLTSEGEFWKRQRRLAQPAFHKEKLNFMFTNMVEQTKVCVHHLESYADTDKHVNMSEQLYKLTLDIVNSSLFYNEVDSTTTKIYKLVSNASEIISKRIDSPFQFPTWLPTPNNIQQKNIINEMDALFFSIIDRRRSKMENHHDLLSMLMYAKDEDTGEYMTNQQLRDEILTIFVAGHETTQIALSWTLYLLSKNKDKLKKLYDEIDTTLKGELPTATSIRSLHYLKQVIDESMRCFPPAWIMGRKTIAKDIIGEYEIEADTNIIMPIYVVHHDEKIWQQPYEFIPERFEMSELKEKHKYAYFPFGGGPRLCIGNNFAIQEMQICLAMFLQKFKIEIDEHFIPKLNPLVTLRPMYDMYAKLYKRV